MKKQLTGCVVDGAVSRVIAAASELDMYEIGVSEYVFDNTVVPVMSSIVLVVNCRHIFCCYNLASTDVVRAFQFVNFAPTNDHTLCEILMMPLLGHVSTPVNASRLMRRGFTTATTIHALLLSDVVGASRSSLTRVCA